MVFPLNLGDLVPNDDSFRLLSHELEELDYSLLYQAYSAKGSNPAVIRPQDHVQDPYLCGFPNIYSSRKIETACRRDVNFMWLLAGRKLPATAQLSVSVSAFWRTPAKIFFYQLVRRLEESGKLSKETVFIDGTKLEACANKYTFVWKKSVGKWEAKMFQKIQEAVSLLNQEYIQSFQVTESTRIQDLQELCRFLEQDCEEQHTVFVYGRGKRKSRIQKYPELFRRFLERQESYKNILSEKGILYRMNRSIQMEGAFGVLKNDYEFQRFLLQGKTKVMTGDTIT